MPDLEDIPREVGQRFIAKAMQIRERTALAKWLLTPTLKAIHWSLIGSIALFMGGLIYQLWTTLAGISTRVLLVASILDSIAAALLAIFMVGVTLHAIFSPESPFETAFSHILRFAIGFLRGRPLSNALKRWSNPDPSSAAHHFCELIADCDDTRLLNIGAPVLIECLDLISFNGGRWTIEVENAIAQILTTATTSSVKLMVLEGIGKISRSEQLGLFLRTVADEP